MKEETHTLPPPHHTCSKKVSALRCGQTVFLDGIINEKFIEFRDKLLELTESEE